MKKNIIILSFLVSVFFVACGSEQNNKNAFEEFNTTNNSKVEYSSNDSSEKLSTEQIKGHEISNIDITKYESWKDYHEDTNCPATWSSVSKAIELYAEESINSFETDKTYSEEVLAKTLNKFYYQSGFRDAVKTYINSETAIQIEDLYWKAVYMCIDFEEDTDQTTHAESTYEDFKTVVDDYTALIQECAEYLDGLY